MNQKRGNNDQKFRRKFFLVKIGARKKGFLKPKSGQKWQKIGGEKNSQHWGEFKKRQKRFYLLSQNRGENGKNLKKLRYKWIFGDRKSFFPKKISKMFEFKAKTGTKMTKKKTQDKIKKNKSKFSF